MLVIVTDCGPDNGGRVWGDPATRTYVTPYSSTMDSIACLRAGSDGTIESYDLSCPSPSPCPLPSSTSHSLIKGLSPNHFAVVEPGGVVSVHDTLYGTRQASVETGLHTVTKVTPLRSCRNNFTCDVPSGLVCE